MGSQRNLRVTIASVCLAMMVPASASAQDLKQVTVGFSSNITINNAIQAAATELGYFKDEGIAVTVQPFQGGSVVMTQVATKSIQIGAATGDPLIIANQPGKTAMPLKFFYPQNRDYNWEFVVPEDSPIKSLEDLKGKTVGVGALTNSHMPVTRRILKDVNLEPSKDYDFLAIGVGGPAFKALMDGQVNVYFTLTANIANFEALGTKLRRIPFGDRYKTLFQNSYFAHQDTFRENPEILVGYGRGVAKATIVCQISPEWCIQNFWKHYPDIKPREGDEAENVKKMVQPALTAWSSFWAFPEGQPKRWGSFPEGSWRNLVDILHDGGEIVTKDVDVNQFFTDELTDAINNFDVAAIEAQAKALQ